MAGKKLTKKIEAELKSYVDEYGRKKSIYDEEKKLIDKLNGDIKKIMLDYQLDKYEGDDTVVTCTVSDVEEMNEARLLQTIKTVIWADKGSMHCPFIKTVEQVDFDALEKAIYNGDITEDQLLEIGKCKEVKQRTTLRIKKVKK